MGVPSRTFQLDTYIDRVTVTQSLDVYDRGGGALHKPVGHAGVHAVIFCIVRLCS